MRSMTPSPAPIVPWAIKAGSFPHFASSFQQLPRSHLYSHSCSYACSCSYSRPILSSLAHTDPLEPYKPSSIHSPHPPSIHSPHHPSSIHHVNHVQQHHPYPCLYHPHRHLRHRRQLPSESPSLPAFCFSLSLSLCSDTTASPLVDADADSQFSFVLAPPSGQAALLPHPPTAAAAVARSTRRPTLPSPPQGVLGREPDAARRESVPQVDTSGSPYRVCRDGRGGETVSAQAPSTGRATARTGDDGRQVRRTNHPSSSSRRPPW